MILRAAASSAPTAGTPPVNQDITVASGPGANLQPKATLYRATAGTALGTEVNAYRILLGMTDGTTQRSIGAMAENGQSSANQDCETRHDTATVVQAPLGASGAINGEARWDSWQNGGSRIAWDDLLNAASLITSVDFYGDDIEVAVVEFTGSASINGTASVSGLSFAPDLAIHYSHFNAFAADGLHADGHVSIGYAVKTLAGGIEQVCLSDHNHDRPPLSWAGATVLRDDCVVAQIDQAADGARLELTSWNSDGATYTTRDVAFANVTAILFVRFKSQRRLTAVVLPTSDPGGGAPWLDTSSSGEKLISLGFGPAAYFMLGTTLPSKNTTNRANTVRSQFSDGVWTGVEQGCISCQAGDTNALLTQSATRSVTSALVADVLKSVTGGAAARDWAASHVGVSPLGPTVDITTASAAARQVAIMAIGDVDAHWPKRPNVWRMHHARR